MKNRFYVLEQRIREVEARAHEILPPSRIKKLNKLSEEIQVPLDSERLVNLNRWWQAKVYGALEAMGPDAKFRKRMTEDRRWSGWKQDATVMQDYIQFAGLQDEYSLLCHSSWTEVQHVLNSLATYPLYLPSIHIGAYIRNNGSIEKCYADYLKKNCEPATLKISEDLMNTLNDVIKQLNPVEIEGLKNALPAYIQHVISNGEPMPDDQFHALIFKTV